MSVDTVVLMCIYEGGRGEVYPAFFVNHAEWCFYLCVSTCTNGSCCSTICGGEVLFRLR
jgi:hypothetical protein